MPCKYLAHEDKCLSLFFFFFFLVLHGFVFREESQNTYISNGENPILSLFLNIGKEKYRELQNTLYVFSSSSGSR